MNYALEGGPAAPITQHTSPRDLLLSFIRFDNGRIAFSGNTLRFMALLQPYITRNTLGQPALTQVGAQVLFFRKSHHRAA